MELIANCEAFWIHSSTFGFSRVLDSLPASITLNTSSNKDDSASEAEINPLTNTGVGRVTLVDG